MNVLVTAGGTAEKIDNVRSITNTSTGALGSRVAEAFLCFRETNRLFFVCGANSLTPDLDSPVMGIPAAGTPVSTGTPVATEPPATMGTPAAPAGDRLEIIRIEDTAELDATVRRICASEKIDAVIHSMAVSDYTVKNVTTSESIARSVLAVLPTIKSAEPAAEAELSAAAKAVTGVEPPAESAPTAELEKISILRGAVSSAATFDRDGKISSDVDDMVLLMSRTPKIIGLLRGLLPEAVLVGFKLLDGVSREDLIATALALLERNSCDFVLANDLRCVTDGGHIGCLVEKDGLYTEYSGKENIAAGIAERVRDTINGRQ